MSSRKEEERNEKIIRGLMKLPPNRRCINCNSLGPQYVCTNFWTFVCMTCSGIHREFTHRVKSVSMSKFTTQEVEALQEGGNQRARETFLKDWDPRGQRLPDNSNVDRVREFIKSVYVDKKFIASNLSGKPPRDTLNLRNQEDETRRASSYHSYSQSPPYDYQYEDRRYGKQAPTLTKKPGSDRGMFRFLSTNNLSDHVQEDSFANEVSNARASDYTGNSGGDPFRSDNQSPTYRRELGFSSPGSETSRDILSENVQQCSVNTFSNSKSSVDLNQKTGSSATASIAQLNSDGSSFRSVNSVDKDFIAPKPEQSAVMQHNKDSTLPDPSHSSDSVKFDGLDLFNEPYLPQSATSAPSADSGNFDGLDLFSVAYAPQSTKSAPSAIDLFELSSTSLVGALSINTSQPPQNSVAPTSIVNQQFKAFEPSSLDLFAFMPRQQSAEAPKDNSSDMISQKNEGWASFDMPWHAEPSQGSKSSINVPETSTSNESLGKCDQAPSLDKSYGRSFHQNFSASASEPSSLVHPWHGGVHDFGASPNANNDQSWNAFGESTTPFQSIYNKSDKHILVQEASTADPYLAWGISENFKMKQADVDTRSAPFLSTTPNAIGTLHSSSELPVMDGAQSHGVERKSRNPFDFSSDSDLESSNMFLDMSSLQSALPNHNMSTAWFPESVALPLPYSPGKSQDALAFMAVQAPSMQISNIQAQGPVASVSGNPFG